MIALSPPGPSLAADSTVIGADAVALTEDAAAIAVVLDVAPEARLAADASKAAASRTPVN